MVNPASIVVMAKEPKPGAVKTRLVPPLTPDEAASLARAFLRDLTRRMARVANAEVVVALPPDDSADRVDAWLGTPVRFADQGTGDLGARLARTLDREHARGERVAMAVGSDHPSLPRATVEATLGEARKGNVGWATTEDGGYACIALPRSLPGLFEGVPWSTPAVADATRNNAARLGVSLVDHGPWYDVDTAADLERLLRDRDLARHCPDTLEVIQRLVPAWDERREGPDG